MWSRGPQEDQKIRHVFAVASQEEDSESQPPLVGSLHVLHVPSWISLSQCKDILIILISDSKPVIGVDVTVCSCLFLCITPVMDCQPVQDIHHLLPSDSITFDG